MDRTRAAIRMRRARAALGRLTAVEQATLFREFGRCACATAGTFAVKNPKTALGALLGGLVGAALGMSVEEKKK